MSKVRANVFGLLYQALPAWALALLAVISGALFTAALTTAAYSFSKQQLRQRFELLAADRYSRIAERLADQQQRLDSLRRFFSYSDNVTAGEFQGYVKPLLKRTLAYAWAPAVATARWGASAELAVHDASTDAGGQAQVQPLALRGHAYPIRFVQTSNLPGLPSGLELFNLRRVQSTLVRATTPGSMAVSAPWQLPEQPAAVVLMMLAPVFANVAGEGVPSGYVIVLLDLQRLVSEGVSAATDDDLVVRISDGSGQNLLYQSLNPAAPLAMVSARQLQLAGYPYQMLIRPSQSFVHANRSSLVPAVALLGALLSLLLGALLYSVLSQRQRALKLVEQRTAELRISEQSLRGTHNQLRSVLDAATQVAIIATDLKGRIITFNAGAERMLGYAASEVVGRLDLPALIHADELHQCAQALSQQHGRDISCAQAIFADAAQAADNQPGEWTLQRSDGSQLLATMLVSPVLDEHGRWVGYLAICIDVTERRRVHEALAVRDRLLEKLSAEVPGGIYQYRLDASGHTCFPYASQGLFDIYEIDLHQLREDAAPITERIHPDDLERVLRSIRYSAEHLAPWREEYRVILPQAGLRWVRGEATPELGEAGCTLWHGYLTDVSEPKRVEHELRALSITDVLTGIHNRRYFQERLKIELDRAARDGLELAVIMLDVDHFKRINDEHGHAVGDDVLRSLCQHISHRLRRTDVFCRLGGEEFMVLCPGSDIAQTRTLALELWQGVRSLVINGVGKVTASFGVAAWHPGEGADALLLRADAGVYAAKQSGRDRVEVVQP
ncbi:diguanylate cyclase [Pseudomonas plecoglossicida]|uniref:sensor domain-containing diguanylate cyclase n=1 Tax=Pseudomonas plecoglossicida TaxID=70775 RepID=UPI0015E3318E|nr:diguanylate cyclase [Pseudomonas plecoglossicida]MBA1196114.1 diguanylate cyclase [Pseudomonas plecoglossicida]